MLFHAELEDPSVAAEADNLSHNHPPTLYSTFLASRPQKLEIDAIALITKLQHIYPSLRCHIVHLSASSALPLIRAAKASGLKLTVETCYHYLCLSSNDIPDGRPEFKCCPPIRENANRELLWQALKDGLIDCVVSDHSPCVTELKKLDEGDIMGAWGGISTLGLGLSLLWTEGRQRGIDIGDIINWTSVKTAEHAGLSEVKGQLKVGYDADLVIWDPATHFTVCLFFFLIGYISHVLVPQVTKESLNFKNKVSPYEGLTLFGRVEQTFLRGRLVYDITQGGFEGLDPIGKLF